jgi:hypothetical protein
MYIHKSRSSCATYKDMTEVFDHHHVLVDHIVIIIISAKKRPLLDIELPKECQSDRSCATRIQRTAATFTRSSVHLMGGPTHAVPSGTITFTF